MGYCCWHVARLLVARGARTGLWHAAALGLHESVAALLDIPPAPTSEQLDDTFWQAWHGGQPRMAEYLLARGAGLNAVPQVGCDTTKPNTSRRLRTWRGAGTVLPPSDARPAPGSASRTVVCWALERVAAKRRRRR